MTSNVLVKAETTCDTPLNVTVELPVNPLPLISRVKGPLPAPPEAGVRPVITGTGFDDAADTVKLAGVELPPPGGGLITITGKFPASARSETLRTIDSELPFKKDVTWATPLKVTVDKLRQWGQSDSGDSLTRRLPKSAFRDGAVRPG
jgi:hypothetical protein